MDAAVEDMEEVASTMKEAVSADRHWLVWIKILLAQNAAALLFHNVNPTISSATGARTLVK
jgi:hypothetical protein